MLLTGAIEGYLLEQQLRSSPPAARESYHLNLTIPVPARSGQSRSRPQPAFPRRSRRYLTERCQVGGPRLLA